jgi:hypothetical protein
VPLGLTEPFASDPSKSKQWTAFVKRGRLRISVPSLPEVVERLHTFLWPPATAARDRQRFGATWRHSHCLWE